MLACCLYYQCWKWILNSGNVYKEKNVSDITQMVTNLNESLLLKLIVLARVSVKDLALHDLWSEVQLELLLVVKIMFWIYNINVETFIHRTLGGTQFGNCWIKLVFLIWNVHRFVLLHVTSLRGEANSYAKVVVIIIISYLKILCSCNNHFISILANSTKNCLMILHMTLFKILHLKVLHTCFSDF